MRNEKLYLYVQRCSITAFHSRMLKLLSFTAFLSVSCPYPRRCCLPTRFLLFGISEATGTILNVKNKTIYLFVCISAGKTSSQYPLNTGWRSAFFVFGIYSTTQGLPASAESISCPLNLFHDGLPEPFLVFIMVISRHKRLCHICNILYSEFS
ncbi:hypothetical protein C823_000931 [Eubacterium plexicaudatum ASF492]|uniref:Uncharacterized protein n=1 Tax=Eubacterium plexicaudatum ASF492 TaxID=1235802 RepID=N1ZTU4_9FIRM|nr:hypothetical protein C823_000931 [Eubacterium plexicaudatum ASF492]